jgi:hypothetical protein
MAVTALVLVNGKTTNETTTNTTTGYETYLYGLITIDGKGGISAQNTLDLEATLSVNETVLGHNVSSLFLSPLGATPPSFSPSLTGAVTQYKIGLGRVN